MSTTIQFMQFKLATWQYYDLVINNQILLAFFLGRIWSWSEETSQGSVTSNKLQLESS